MIHDVLIPVLLIVSAVVVPVVVIARECKRPGAPTPGQDKN